MKTTFTKKQLFGLIFITLLLLNVDAFAQCAMCRANAESGMKNGPSIARGLNSGILYLMAIPYLLLMFIFREQIKSVYQKIKTKYATK